MPRAQFRDTALLRGAGGILTVAPLGSLVAVVEIGTNLAIGEQIWADESSMAQLPNPLPTANDGLIDFWLDHEREFDVIVSCPGYGSVRATVTADSAGGWEEGGTFHNPIFTGTVGGQPIWDLAQGITISTAAQPYIDHNSLSQLGTQDPHTQYLTTPRADTRYEPKGAAASGDAAHVAASDPHTQYLTQAEGDLRYYYTWRGEWSAAANYAFHDAVSYNGSSYLCIAAVPAGGQTPDLDTFHWNYLAKQGGVGPAGPQGQPGPTGDPGPQGPPGFTTVGGFHEEFVPAAAATYVDLAGTPSVLLTVARDGVVQSAAAGNYSLSGRRLTLTDACSGTERLVVAYLTGSSGGGETGGAIDTDLRAYVEHLMALIDPTGPPPPSP